MWPTSSRLPAFLRSRTVTTWWLKKSTLGGALSTTCKRSDQEKIVPFSPSKAHRSNTRWSLGLSELGKGSGTSRFLFSTDASDAGGSEKGGVSDALGEGGNTSAGEGDVSASVEGGLGEKKTESGEEEENRWWENAPKPKRMRRRERHGRYGEDIEDEIASFPVDDSLTHLYNARAIVEEYMKNKTDLGMVPPEFLTEEGLKALAAELQAEERVMEAAEAGHEGEEGGEEGLGSGERVSGAVEEGREEGRQGEVALGGESREFLEGLKGVMGELSGQAAEGSESGDPPGEGPILRWETRMVLGPGGDAWHPANRKVKVSVTVKEIGLSVLGRDRLLALVGRRYNGNKDELTIISEKYAQREENRKDVYRTLLELLEDAKTADELASEAGELPQSNGASGFA